MNEEERTGRQGEPASRSFATPSFEAYGGSAPENYERYFVPAIAAPLAADLINAARLRAGERVLDVACGTGVVARQAAERVGPTGAVVGTDINAGMLAVARAVTPAGVSIEWQEASAENLGFNDNAFDVALCQMGLQFFADKAGALREMWRVLRRGGRVLLNLPGPMPRPFVVLADALRQHVAPQTAGFVDAVFSLHNPAAIRDLLSAAGLQDVTTESAAKRLRLPPPAEFLWQYVRSTPLASHLAQADSERRAAIERDVVAEWSNLTQDGELLLEVNVVTASGIKR